MLSIDMYLQSAVKVLITEKGIRRAVLLDRVSSMPLELQSVFVWHKRPTKSLNSHKANLRDLSHFEEWCLYQKENNKKWQSPLNRLLQKQLPLKKGEIDDYFSWAQKKASVLSNERRVSRNKNAPLRKSRAGDVVDARTTDRKLRTVSQYLCWLTDLILNDFINLGRKELIEIKQIYKVEMRDHFSTKISKKKAGSIIRSLDEKAAGDLRNILEDKSVFKDTICGNRDRLIVDFDLNTGLRPGELLALQTNDITCSTVVLRSGKRKKVGVLSVVKRPNNPKDTRIDSPSAKTLSGFVTFSYSLYIRLSEYIMGPRREAVNSRGGIETEFLFVNHAGKAKGQSMQQRNLNRIFKTLKKSPDIPDSISPYTMRHTHFTEFSDEVVASGGDLRSELSARGRWSVNSSSMDGYILRDTSNKSAQRIAERDEELEPNENMSR